MNSLVDKRGDVMLGIREIELGELLEVIVALVWFVALRDGSLNIWPFELVESRFEVVDEPSSSRTGERRSKHLFLLVG